MAEGRGVYRVLVGKPEEKSLLGRPRRRCGYNIKMGFQIVGYGLDRAGSGYRHVTGTCKCGNEPRGNS
jgi:hypothetical protein